MDKINIETKESLDKLLSSWDKIIEDLAIEMLSVCDKDGIALASSSQKMVDGYLSERENIINIFKNGKFYAIDEFCKDLKDGHIIRDPY